MVLVALLLPVAWTSGTGGVAAQSAAHYDSLGTNLVRAERYREALPSLLRAQEMEPGRSSAAMNLGKTYASMGDLDAAVAQFRRAQTLGESAANVTYWIGFVEAIRGRIPQAVAAARKVAELEASSVRADVMLTFARLSAGDARAAVEPARRVAAALPRSAFPHILLGEALLATGEAREARERFEQAITIAPDARSGPTGHYAVTGLAAALLVEGRADEAAPLIERSIRLNRAALDAGLDSHGYAYDLAAAYALRGDHEKALEWLERALEHGWRKAGFAEHDPMLRNLPDQPRFRELAAAARARSGVAASADGGPGA